MIDVNLTPVHPIKASLPKAHAPTAQPRTLVERAYLAMRQDIVQGLLAPGERLRVEHLKDRYDVGAGTLREALALLVSDALVKVESQRGYKVAPISLDDLKDLTDTRVMLETSALRQSIRLGDAQWEQELRQTFDALRQIEQKMDTVDPVTWELANKRFHETLISAYCSPWSQRLLDILYRHGERYRRVAIRMGAAQTIHRDVHAEHSSIFNAAVARQEARAALALEAHIRLTCDVLQHQDFQMDVDGQMEKIVCT